MLSVESLQYSVAKKKLISIQYLSIEQKKFTALLGPNGAGKSTLLKLISREVEAYSGSIYFHDREIHHWSRRELARHLAVLPQSSQLVFPFTAMEVVNLGATPLSLSHRERKKKVLEFMALLDCVDLANQTFMQLSGGQKQRVQLARVLLQLSQAELPPLLLLDEPTSAQDIRQQHIILALVKKLAVKEGYGIVAVLHELNHALRYADEACVLSEGELIKQSPPEVALDVPTIEEVWRYSPTLWQQDGAKSVIY